MREILFRAKSIEYGDWVEGIPIKTHLGLFICYEENPHYCSQYGYMEIDDIVRVDEETLCEYTGLTDKNGNKIWENDICDRIEKYPEIVKMNMGDWTLDYSYLFRSEYGRDYCNLGFYAGERNCVQVIGNIFDNPELLEVKDDTNKPEVVAEEGK